MILAKGQSRAIITIAFTLTSEILALAQSNENEDLNNDMGDGLTQAQRLYKAIYAQLPATIETDPFVGGRLQTSLLQFTAGELQSDITENDQMCSADNEMLWQSLQHSPRGRKEQMLRKLKALLGGDIKSREMDALFEAMSSADLGGTRDELESHMGTTESGAAYLGSTRNSAPSE